MKATSFPGKDPEGHPWLTQIYAKKKQWSRAWLQFHFTCGMRSSQLSESCNSNMRHYLKPSLTLDEFFDQFIRLVENKREKQLERDFQMLSAESINRFPDSLIASQLAKVYTPLVFKRCCEEYGPTMSYSMLPLGSNDEGMRWFNVFKRQMDGTTTDNRAVAISADGSAMECKCHMYEMEGLLCRHLIRARELLGNIENEDFLKVDPTLIMRRYSRAALDGLELGPAIPSIPREDVAKYNEMNAAMSLLREKVDGDAYLMSLVIEATNSLSIQIGSGRRVPDAPADPSQK
ncbi:Protein FAR-RED IMPAIRED RESPONSE 1, partial [Linum perenne]